MTSQEALALIRELLLKHHATNPHLPEMLAALDELAS